MIRNLKDFMDLTVTGSDGPIGAVRDFYFDDQDWIVRYMVVKLEQELGGRSILLTPQATETYQPERRELLVNVSQEKARNSPDINMEKPVSRQEEQLIYNYYDWPVYWNPNDSFGQGVGDLSSIPMMEMEADLREQMEDAQVAQEEGNNPHLRSLSEVLGYRIMAQDGSIGEVEDFLFEDDTWKILYLQVDINGLRRGGKVLISPDWAERVSWTQSMVFVNLPTDVIRDAPEYDPNQTELDRDYESRLYEHFHQPKYWDKNDLKE